MFEKIGSTIPSLLSFPLPRQGLIDTYLRYFSAWEGLDTFVPWLARKKSVTRCAAR